MAREFYVSGRGLTLANQPVTLVFLNPPAAPNVGIKILRCWVSQTGSVVSAMLPIALVTQVAAFPTLVSATPRKAKLAEPNVAALVGGTAGAAGTAGINASAEGAGTKTEILGDGFNVLNGWSWIFTDPETIELPAGLASGIGMYLPEAPATLTKWNFGMTYREI